MSGAEASEQQDCWSVLFSDSLSCLPWVREFKIPEGVHYLIENGEAAGRAMCGVFPAEM